MLLVLSIILVIAQTLVFILNHNGHMNSMNPIVDAILGKNLKLQKNFEFYIIYVTLSSV